MLGIVISERTVSRILRGLPRPPSQTWKTFFHNHIGQMVSLDFFTLPTTSLKVLFVFFVLELRRRKVLHVAVTEHPTAAWTAQQIVEAFADRDAARFLVRDRDSIYGLEVRAQIATLGMEEVLTAPQSPWQKDYASYCTSLVTCVVTSSTRRRLENFTPCALGGGLLPGCSNKYSFLSL